MRYALVAIFALSTSGAAFAGAMQDSEDQDAVQTKADAAGKDVARQCEGTVIGKVDRPTFTGDGVFDVAGGYCSTAISGVGGACEALPTHKKEILKAIKSVTCHYDATLTENHAVKVTKTGTNLNVSFNKKSANIAESVREYLKKTL